MSINGKRDRFTVADLREVARVAGLKRGRADTALTEVSAAVAGWRAIAEEVGIAEEMADEIARSHRLALPAA
jgi:serine/threonine-protein kinase HipA